MLPGRSYSINPKAGCGRPPLGLGLKMSNNAYMEMAKNTEGNP